MLGFGISVIPGIDPNPDNYVSAGVINTKSLLVGCLVRLEPNLQTKVRSQAGRGRGEMGEEERERGEGRGERGRREGRRERVEGRGEREGEGRGRERVGELERKG